MGNAKKHILNMLIWAICLYVIIVLDAYFGALVGVGIPLGLVGVVAVSLRIRKARIFREIAKIDDADGRAIRLDGRVSQLKIAEQVANRLGWDAETNLDDAGKIGSIRLIATTASSPPKVLLQALFDAGVAKSVKQ